MADELTRLLNDARVATSPAPRPPKSRMREGLSISLLAIYTAIVLAVTMNPTPVDAGYQGAIARLIEAMHRRGVPEWFGYGEVEFLANVAMFVPLGFLVGLALPTRISWLALLITPGFSAAIEWTQWSFLADRFATLQDVLANSIGGWVGTLIAFIIRAMVHARDEKVIARARWDARHRSRTRQ